MDDTNFVYSASSLKTLSTCGYKFYLSKVEKLEKTDEPSHHSFLGLVVHNSIYTGFATYGTEKKSWELLENKPDYTRAYDFFDAAWSEDATTTDEFKQIILNDVSKKPKDFWKKLKVEQLNSDNKEDLEFSWREHANRMMVNGLEMLADVKIIELEREMRFSLMGKNFLGFIDVVAEDAEGKVCFYDLKTTWEKPTSNKISQDLQFILYSAALKILLKLDYYPSGYWCHLKTSEFVKFEMTTDIRRKSAEKLTELFKIVENNDFMKATHLKNSLCPYCDYFSKCFSSEHAVKVRKTFINE